MKLNKYDWTNGMPQIQQNILTILSEGWCFNHTSNFRISVAQWMSEIVECNVDPQDEIFYVFERQTNAEQK